jgi:L-iditol 2-dehydrogenase
MMNGLLDTRGLPRILGHEIVGEVESEGSGSGPTLVVADAVVGCGKCPWCIRGEESICPEMRHLGIDLDGGFAEYVLAPEGNLFPLPKDAPIDQAVMLASAVPASVHAIRRSQLTYGATVAVLGIGSIGLAVCQLLRALGASQVVAADVSGERLAAANPWIDGAVNVAGLEPKEIAARLLEVGGSSAGFDFAFDTAGAPPTLEATLRTVRPGGTALLMGIREGSTPIPFDDYFVDFMRRELTIRSTFGFTRQDFLVGNGLFASGRLDLSPLVAETISLEDVPEALARIGESGTRGLRYLVSIGRPSIV